MLLAIVILASALLIAILVLTIGLKRPAAAESTVTTTGAFTQDLEPHQESTDYSRDEVDATIAQCLRLGLGSDHQDDAIDADHTVILQKIAESIDTAVQQRDYFPRRPMMLPRLLQALNDAQSTRTELSRLILEDPTLTASVLERANSVFYRVSNKPVETIEKAVVMLGQDGLRGIMATAILQPVFRVPAGDFEHFATYAWEHAQRTSFVSELYARATRSADPFVAQLLGVLRILSNIVLFRVAMDKYRETPRLTPSPAVFIRAIQLHRGPMAIRIATSWGLSQASLAALEQQDTNLPPVSMTSLGQALSFGELCGALAVLVSHSRIDDAAAQDILLRQGYDPGTVATLWPRALSGPTRK